MSCGKQINRPDAPATRLYAERSPQALPARFGLYGHGQLCGYEAIESAMIAFQI
jgi:hypothetical protein